MVNLPNMKILKIFNNSVRKIFLSIVWIKKYYFLKRRISKIRVLKLHIGCGTIYKKHWINIDDNVDNNIAKLDLKWNLLNRLPFNSQSVDFIYNEHFIEHLSYQEGLTFLKNMYELLKIGGVIRIACPDLDKIISGYSNNTWRKNEWVTKYKMEWIRNSCEMINICLNVHPWGHKYVYNFEELISALIKSGFKKRNLKKVGFRKSKYKDLCGLETRRDSLIIEAVK